MTPSVTDRHVDVTCLLGDAITTTLCSGCEALQYGTFFNEDGFYLQFVDISTIVVFGVGDRGLEHFLDEESTFFRAESKNIQRLVDLFPADQVSN